MSRLFLTAVDHVSRDFEKYFRSPCANMTLGVAALFFFEKLAGALPCHLRREKHAGLGVAALAAEFFGVSFLSPAC
jgi:hypothetical protein